MPGSLPAADRDLKGMSTISTAFEIELATSAQAPEVLRLIAQLYEGEAIPFRAEAMGAALSRLLAEPDLGFVLVARQRESRALAGYGIATFGFDVEFAGHDAFITDLYVEPSARNRGLGQALLDALADGLRERGAKAVHLMVRPENERARALYEARGFNVVPRTLMTKLL
jgi:ribosomal protein S18 acetylase RimI-like enzyme